MQKASDRKFGLSGIFSAAQDNFRRIPTPGNHLETLSFFPFKIVRNGAVPHIMMDGKRVLLTRVSKGGSGTAELIMNNILNGAIADKFITHDKPAISNGELLKIRFSREEVTKFC